MSAAGAEPSDTPPPDAMATSRLEAFSDGVIAIAATLLVLELERPGPGETVWEALGAQWSSVVGFVVSFTTIGILWISHHTLFHLVRWVNRPLLLLNLVTLGAITFLPYATGALGSQAEETRRAADVLYSLTFVATSSGFLLIRLYLHRHPLMLVPQARAGTAAAVRGSLVGPVGYLLATGMALVVPLAGLVMCALVAVYFLVWNSLLALTRSGSRDEQPAAG